jgi:hypothetical protein
MEHRERPRNRLRLAARVVQRDTVEHLDFVFGAALATWDEATSAADEARPRSVPRSLCLRQPA